MKNFLPVSVLLATLGLGAVLRAQTVATDPVGAVNISLKGNSDTVVSVPLTPMPAYSGTVASTAAAGANLNVSGTTGWTANQFANLYYVRMTSGAKNGMFYTITANTTGQVTIDGAGDNLSTIAAADSFKILKYWTLGTLFPTASAGTAVNPLTASASTSPVGRKSLVLFRNANAPGVASAASAAYYFTSTNWYAAGTNAVSDNIVLYPDEQFVIRQPSGLADQTWTVAGAVVTGRLTTPLLTLSTGPQDNPVAMVRPVDLTLSQLGLESAFVDSASTSPLTRRDQLLVLDNTVTGINKSAARVYYRTAGSWRRAGADTVVADADLIKAGDGFTIRKYKTASGTSVVWTNNPTY